MTNEVLESKTYYCLFNRGLTEYLLPRTKLNESSLPKCGLPIRLDDRKIIQCNTLKYDRLTRESKLDLLNRSKNK